MVPNKGMYNVDARRMQWLGLIILHPAHADVASIKDVDGKGETACAGNMDDKGVSVSELESRHRTRRS